MDQLDLAELRDGNIPAITPAIGNLLGEAATVCLQSQGHVQNVRLIIAGMTSSELPMKLIQIDDRSIEAWNDLQEATEFGAVGIAILLAINVVGYQVIQRSRKGTGIDYWLGDDTVWPYTRTARLEVSGILSGNERSVRSRVRSKLRQTERSDATHGGLPAYVIVVEFATPLAEIQQK